jgi:hypothetical protein
LSESMKQSGTWISLDCPTAPLLPIPTISETEASLN